MSANRSPPWSAAARPASPSPTAPAGKGVNADNIKRCLEILRDRGFTGHLSIECEGQGGPLLTESLHWLRQTLAELGIPEEKA